MAKTKRTSRKTKQTARSLAWQARKDDPAKDPKKAQDLILPLRALTLNPTLMKAQQVVLPAPTSVHAHHADFQLRPKDTKSAKPKSKSFDAPLEQLIEQAQEVSRKTIELSKLQEETNRVLEMVKQSAVYPTEVVEEL